MLNKQKQKKSAKPEMILIPQTFFYFSLYFILCGLLFPIPVPRHH